MSDQDTFQHETAGVPDEAARVEVLGLDNVALDLPLAGVGSRALAMTIDLFVLAILLALVSAGVLAIVSWGDLPFSWAVIALAFAWFSGQWIYFSLCEITTEGRTPGKSMVGLRTVTSLGGLPSKGSILVRNFLRFFDLFLGWPLMAFDPSFRRIGDLLASTLVIHDRGDEHQGVRLGRVPTSWGGREIAVVESFLGRAERMDPGRARDLGTKLLGWLRHREPSFLADAPDDAQATFDPDQPVDTLRRVFAAEQV